MKVESMFCFVALRHELMLCYAFMCYDMLCFDARHISQQGFDLALQLFARS